MRGLQRNIVMEIANKSVCKSASLDLDCLYIDQRIRLSNSLYNNNSTHRLPLTDSSK